MRVTSCLLAGFAVALCMSPKQHVAAPKSELPAAYAAVLAAGDGPAFQRALERYKSLLPKIDGVYLVEGDLLRTDNELHADLVFARARLRGLKQQIGPELLVALRPNGARDYWADRADRTITYSVDRRSFPSPDQAAEVIARLQAAAADWEAACADCGIRFVFRDDASPSHNRVVFIVRRVDSRGHYVAAAFFPSYAAKRRYLNIDKTFFTTKADRTGVLRHEIGHTLGYRHEHIRGIAGCALEGSQWVPLTKYDPKSVMHYMCGDGGDINLALTALDRQGHTLLYGGQP